MKWKFYEVNLKQVNSSCQGHLVTLAKGNQSVVCQHFQRTFLELLGQFQFNFTCSLQAKEERKIIYLVQVA